MRTLSPTSKPMSEVAAGVYKPTPFFEAVTMLTSPCLLRRVTLCHTTTLKRLDCGIRRTILAVYRKRNASGPDGKWRTSIAMPCCANHWN